MTRSVSVPSDASTATVDLGGRESPAIEPELAVGTQVGRYVVVERVGQGGMARVVRAYDPRLRREVALKLLRSVGDEQAHARIVREAQAMARLSHPNVVAVYDVEELGGCPFIAMEYVEGQTLQQWLREAPRAADEIVEAFVAAGHGLAAAHAMGLVHRDVKLSNILRGHDGRVRVTDFGIARALAESTPEAPESQDAGGSSDATLTLTGTVVGTPPYMAPEQHEGRPADARSDQYGFCVALWEALAGNRPFAGGNMRGLFAAKRDMRTTAPERPMAGWLRSVLLRGLAPAPEHRFATMADLVAVLARGRTRQHHRRAAVALGVAGIVAAGAWGTSRWDRERRARACAAEGDAIDVVWNATRRDELRTALLATNAPHAVATADKVMPWFDEYAESWRTEATGVCLDTRVHETWDDDLLARASWCLDERRFELDAVVTELARGGTQAVDRAVQTAAGLTRVTPCHDATLLQRLPAPPQAPREGIDAVRREISRAAAMERAGHFADQLPVAQQALVDAQTLAWPPLVAAAHLQVARAQYEAGGFDEARAEFETAYFEGVRAGALEVALVAAERLALLAADHDGKSDVAIRWSRHAELLLEQLPDPSRVRERIHLVGLGLVEYRADRLDEAKTLLERALAIAEAELPTDHPAVADVLANLAVVYTELGEFAEAEAMHLRVLAILGRSLGPDHPTLATTHHNMVLVYIGTGDIAAAKAAAERSLAIKEATRGPGDYSIGSSLMNLGALHLQLGEFDRARVVLERALAIELAYLGPEHPGLAPILINLADLDWNTKSYDSAVQRARLAAALWEKAHGPDYDDIARSLMLVAKVARVRGHYAEARTDLRRAVAILEKASGKDSVAVSWPLQGLAEVALDEHRWDEAATLATRVIELQQRGFAEARQRAEARFVLARALAGSGHTRAPAIEEARRARDELARTDAVDAQLRGEIDAFLREQDRRQ